MAKKRREHILETLLRFEIVVALFTLIGVYYYLSFSPVRLPAAPIRSAVLPLALTAENPLASPAPQKAEPAAESSEVTQTTPTASSATGVKAASRATKSLVLTTPESNLPAPPAVTATEIPVSPPTVTATEIPAPAAKSPSRPDSSPPAPAAVLPAASPPAVAAPAAPAKAAAPAAATPSASPESASADDGNVVIQVGTYLFGSRLDEARTLLKKHGYTTRVETSPRQVEMYRMFLGPYPTAAAATAAMRRLGDAVQGPFVSRRADGWYINIGSYYYKHTAQRYLATYRQQGMAPVIYREAVELPQYTLFLDHLPRGRTPAEIVAELHRLGLDDAVVRIFAP